MSAERNFTDQDYERLSAYLDGALTAAERAALETRLQSDDGLRQELEALRQTVNLVRALPPLKAPRNFTLTPSMVRPRSTRWLIFPTSTTFSAISAAAATLLILLGTGMLLLQSGAAGTPSFGAAPAAVQQESSSQIASLPTELPPSEKTAERDQQLAQTTAAAANDLLASTAPPSPVAANGATLPENSATSPIQPPQATALEAPASVTSDGLGYTTASQPTLDEETSQALQSAAPADSTLLFAATMPPPSIQPIAPGAADTAAQTGGSDQQDANAQSSGAAEIMSNQVAATPTMAQLGTENLDAFGLLTATMPAVAQFAALPTGTPTPRPTLAPTMTATASSTPAPTQTPIPTSTQDGRTATVPTVPVDLLTWGALIVGLLLLVVAVITTVIRRRS